MTYTSPGRVCGTCGRPVAEHSVAPMGITERTHFLRMMGSLDERHINFSNSRVRRYERECPGYEGARLQNPEQRFTGKAAEFAYATRASLIKRRDRHVCDVRKAEARAETIPVWREGARRRAAQAAITAQFFVRYVEWLLERLNSDWQVVGDVLTNDELNSAWAEMRESFYRHWGELEAAA